MTIKLPSMGYGMILIGEGLPMTELERGALTNEPKLLELATLLWI